MPLVTEVGLGQATLCEMGWDPAPSPQKEAKQPPQFSAHVCRGQTAGWIKMPLGMELGLGPGHIVLDGDPPLQFSAHVCCAQTAGSIKMPLGTEVEIGSGYIVL